MIDQPFGWIPFLPPSRVDSDLESTRRAGGQISLCPPWADSGGKAWHRHPSRVDSVLPAFRLDSDAVSESTRKRGIATLSGGFRFIKENRPEVKKTWSVGKFGTALLVPN
jgi:hypothetical protein